MQAKLEGIAARSDFDLSQHERFSGKPMGVFDEELRAAWGKLPKEKQDELWRRYYENRKKYLTKWAWPEETPEQDRRNRRPTTRTAWRRANTFRTSLNRGGRGSSDSGLDCQRLFRRPSRRQGQKRDAVVMKFHPRVAPIKVGVLPLLKNKPELVKKAQAVRDLLRPWMNVFYDDGGSIGRRYAARTRRARRSA
jgi:glycyl-tRNA synthetase